MKKNVHLLLCALIFIATPINAQVVDSGRIGNLVWSLEMISGNITLTISGNGAMEERHQYPWHAYRTSIQAVNIANGVTTIGSQAFSNFSSLTSVTIANSVTSIGAAAFSRNRYLTTVTIPNRIISIGNHAFSGSGLTSVIIPSSLTSIGEGVFANNEALASVTIPNSVTAIGNSAFSGSVSLETIVIPSSVVSIGNSAFYGSGLTSVTIPSSVTSIGFRAFSSSWRLISVTILSSRPPTMNFGLSFGNNHPHIRLFVPQEAILRYQLNDEWNRAFSRILALEEKDRLEEEIRLSTLFCNSYTPGWGESLGTVVFERRGHNIVIQGTGVNSHIVQTWSGAVTATACQKTTFNGSASWMSYNADCRSNPSSHGDFFSWCAVIRFADQLCPYPWRVPTNRDFVILNILLGGTGLNRTDVSHQFVLNNYINRWGASFAGQSDRLGSYWGQDFSGSYWSKDERDSGEGFRLYFDAGQMVYPQGWSGKGHGLSLRCVR